MIKAITIASKKILPKYLYESIRKLRLNIQFKYLNIIYRGKKQIYNYKGYNFIVRKGTDDDAIVRECLDGDYDMDNEKYGVVIDIGAHIGAYSIPISNRADKVYSFEPNPENFELLKRNIKNQNIKNIYINNLAIANSERTDRLYLSPYSTGAYSIYSEEPTRSVEIKCITLNNFIIKNNLNNIDLLKMDCEGAEYEIIESLDAKTLSKIKRIIMEVHQRQNTSKNHIWMKNYLTDKRYKVSEKINKINGNYYLFAEKKIKRH